MRKSNRLLKALAIASALGLVATACGSDTKTDYSQSRPPKHQPIATADCQQRLPARCPSCSTSRVAATSRSTTPPPSASTRPKAEFGYTVTEETLSGADQAQLLKKAADGKRQA